MGFTVTGRLYKFTIPRKWAWLLDETDETYKYRRACNVSGFDPTSKEKPDWTDLDRNWPDNLDQT